MSKKNHDLLEFYENIVTLNYEEVFGKILEGWKIIYFSTYVKTDFTGIATKANQHIYFTHSNKSIDLSKRPFKEFKEYCEEFKIKFIDFKDKNQYLNINADF